MKLRAAKFLVDRLNRWLDATSIRKRLYYLTLLNVAGLAFLLLLSLVSSALKENYFEAVEELNAQQRQLQHFNIETARIQISIQNYLTSSDKGLKQKIDTATEQLFREISTLKQHPNSYAENLLPLRDSLQTFVTGYSELKELNRNIDSTYQAELLIPSQHAAELLSLVIEETQAQKARTLLGPASMTTISSFIDSLLKMNTFYAMRDTAGGLSTRNSLERLEQLIPLLESLATDELHRKALKQLQLNVHTMISGLGALQRYYALRTQIMENKIEASQHMIAQTASDLDRRYTEIEATLRNRHAWRLAMINLFAITLALLTVIGTFLFSALIFRSIGRPLAQLLRTVEAFSSGHFEHTIPDVGRNEFGKLAGALRDFRVSAMQRTHAERALRDSEGRFRALSDMSSDFFWEKNKQLQYTAFSGQRAGELLAHNVLMLGLRAWENPHNIGYEDAWQEYRRKSEAHEPFRDFEFALQLPDGNPLYLLANGDPMFDADGEFIGYRGTAKDISIQKAAEAQVRLLNQTLEQRVIERTAELRQSNEQLSQAMDQLVQNEKLASLGNLVAGVAHELNTPLGNSLVTATSLRDQVHEMNHTIESGSLRKSDLLGFMRTCEEGCHLIERNAYRAVTLITNFKQVAVDQTSAKRREFNLAQTINEVVATLMPSLRKRQCNLTVDIPDNLTFNSFPGPLDQVITNLVTNATIHAFPPGEAGSILITATTVDAHEVVLMLSDNGVGIPLEQQSRVFDPFFTTRLGQGGSGLGLYIVYNIVTSLLGGHIQLVSAPDAGTCFIIRLPREAPHHEEPVTNIHDALARAPHFR